MFYFIQLKKNSNNNEMKKKEEEEEEEDLPELQEVVTYFTQINYYVKFIIT